MQIKAEAIQLKAFLNVIKSELFPDLNKKQDVLKTKNQTSNNLLRAFGSSNKMLEEQKTKLVIKERTAIPAKGFPRTLKELTVNEIGYSQMPIGILNLTNLLHLDLSQNKISKLPKNLGNLRLIKLVLNDNKLGESTSLKDWEWTNGNILQSLVTLSITKNGLKFVPSNICKCVNIVNLDLSHNQLERIPFSVRQMKKLKILNLSNNLLNSLPYTIKLLKLDLIDLSSNQFPSQTNLTQVTAESHREISQHIYPGSTLLELAARAVIKKQIPYMNHNLPQIIKEILFHSPLCASAKCETLCFDMAVLKSTNIIELNSKEKVTNDNASHFPVDGPFCSRVCDAEAYRNVIRWGLMH